MGRVKKECTCGYFKDVLGVRVRVTGRGCPAHKHRIFITLKGGLIQDIEGIPQGSEVVVMDFDIEGADASEITKWKVAKEKEEAFVSLWSATKQPEGEASLLQEKYKDLLAKVRQGKFGKDQNRR